MWASIVFGSVGLGYLIYGKKQGRLVPAVGGIAIMVVTYAFDTWFSIALASLALMGAVRVLARRYE